MITKISIERRELFAGGHKFPVTGAYEKLVGKAYGAVNPKSPLNRVIINLDKAPRNDRGLVEYWTDLFILKPLDPARGNGKILYDAPNRGSKKILVSINDAPESNDPSALEHAGNGFLMRQGYTIVWSGWQGDIIPGDNFLSLNVPVAMENGRGIVGRVRTEIVVTREGVYSRPLSGHNRVLSYEAASTDKSDAALTVRELSYGERRPVPSSEWEFAHAETNKQSSRLELKASPRHLYLRGGFKPGSIYEFVYLAKNPLVLGLGFACVRDLISFLRYEERDRSGEPNPFALGRKETGVKRAYAWGRSQSGRFLRDLVYHGFNEDESHRQVFDAIAPHAAGGGRCFLNYEFARPVTSSQQHTSHPDPEIFPFAYNVVKDPQTGKRDGILKRPKTDPYVFHTQTSTEYWQKRGSLAHTDGKGKDLKLPEKVRMYAIAGTQHNAPYGGKPKLSEGQQLTNPLPLGEALRALIVALDRWVSDGIPPPLSQIPLVRDGTLVAAERIGFPKIPGVRYNELYNRIRFLDYGPNLHRGKIEHHPPKPIKEREYKVLLPKVDRDGNEIGGVRLTGIRVPLGTHTGWNLQRRELAEDELAALLGSYIPFAATREERLKTGDPRLSLEERYEDLRSYVEQVARAARALVEERLILSEDAERLIAEAENCRLFAAPAESAIREAQAL
jgi:hypothetical protein